MKAHLRDQVLREWRGLPQKVAPPDKLKTAAELMAGVLRGLGLEERLTEAQMISAWEEIVGEFIATHSRPAKLRAGVLFIQVLQPTVHYELDRVWKAQILKKMKERFGAKRIREVRFCIG